jgi:hypothetical protein
VGGRAVAAPNRDVMGVPGQYVEGYIPSHARAAPTSLCIRAAPLTEGANAALWPLECGVNGEACAIGVLDVPGRVVKWLSGRSPWQSRRSRRQQHPLHEAIQMREGQWKGSSPKSPSFMSPSFMKKMFSGLAGGPRVVHPRRQGCVPPCTLFRETGGAKHIPAPPISLLPLT